MDLAAAKANESESGFNINDYITDISAQEWAENLYVPAFFTRPASESFRTANLSQISSGFVSALSADAAKTEFFEAMRYEGSTSTKQAIQLLRTKSGETFSSATLFSQANTGMLVFNKNTNTWGKLVNTFAGYFDSVTNLSRLSTTGYPKADEFTVSGGANDGKTYQNFDNGYMERTGTAGAVTWVLGKQVNPDGSEVEPPKIGILKSGVNAPAGYTAGHVEAVFNLHYDPAFGDSDNDLVHVDLTAITGSSGGPYGTGSYVQKFKDPGTSGTGQLYNKIVVLDFGTEGTPSSAEVYVVKKDVWARYITPGYEIFDTACIRFGDPIMNLDTAASRKHQNFQTGYIYQDASNAWRARIGFNWDAAEGKEVSVNDVANIAAFRRGGSLTIPSTYTPDGKGGGGAVRTWENIQAAMKAGYLEAKANHYDIGVADPEHVTAWYGSGNWAAGTAQGMIVQGLQGGESTYAPQWNKTGMLMYNPVDDKAYAVTGVVFANWATLYYTPGYALGNSFTHNESTYQNFQNGYVKVKGSVATFSAGLYFDPALAPNETVSKTALRTAIAAAEGLKFYEYTELTWYELDAALALAKIIEARDDVSQALVERATRELNNARFALESSGLTWKEGDTVKTNCKGDVVSSIGLMSAIFMLAAGLFIRRKAF